MSIFSMHFAAPFILWCLPLPLFIGFMLPKWQKKEPGLKVPFFGELEARFSHHANSRDIGVWKKILALLIYALLVIAAANPQRLGKPVPLPNKGRAMLLAIDLSGSMVIRDMLDHGHLRSRISVVKQVATQFLQQRQGDQIGLILFGENAYLRTPITYDLQTVLHMLNTASVGIAGQLTNIGDAIGLAIKHLAKVPKEDRVLILMTDGRANAGQVKPLVAAQMAKKLHIKIYTIGLDTKTNIPFVSLNVEGPDNIMLQKLAKITGGLYFRAQNASDLASVYQQLNKLEPIATKKRFFAPPTPLYPWPLGLALVLSMLLLLSFCWPLLWTQLTSQGKEPI